METNSASPLIEGLDRGAGLHELFAAIARRRGDAPAVSVADLEAAGGRRESSSYAALDARADAFSRHLARLGVRPGDRVALHLPRGLAQHWAVLGVMKAGAAYAPIDWSSPRERLEAILADCEPRALVAWGPPKLALAGAVPRIDLASAGAEIADEAGRGPATAPGSVSPEDLAYIIYTSGSTGAPKGVMIRHRNIRHFVEAESAFLRIGEDDLVFGAFSLAFDMSIETMWTAWRAGAELICATEELARSPHDLPAALSVRGVTVWHVTPSLLGAVDEDVPGVRLINLGGEACPAALVRRWSRPGRRLVNTYGPTEIAVTATAAELLPDRPVTIGRPLPGYRAWIVDEALAPVPPGSAGELVIGGPGVGAGYVNRPRLTARRFVAAANLVGETAAARGERVYRTGDLARLGESGEIEFLGRADGQVKVRGYRVELEEIEAVLAEHPAVAQAAVALIGREGEEGWLAGYVAPKPGAALDLAALRAELPARLPDYMRPRVLTLLERLPTTVSGKIDRSALPAPMAAEDNAAPGEPPRTALERELLSAWTAAFPDRRFGVLAHFFDDLGGHSLIAARMVSAARKQAGLARLSIQDVYAAPTIRELAERVERRAAGETASTRTAVEKPSEAWAPIPQWRRTACVAAQTLSLFPIYGLWGLQWALPYLIFGRIAAERGTPAGLAAAALAFAATPPLLMTLAIALKRLLIGRLAPGDYPLWGAQYFRWWLGQRILAVAPTEYLAGTPLLNLYARALGARIGKGAFLATDFGEPELVTIGAGAIVSDGASLATARVEGGRLRLAPVTIGASAFVGDMAVVGAGATVGEAAYLDDLSALPPGARIGDGERWSGSPARPIGAAPAVSAPPAAGPARKAAVLAGLIAAGILLPLASLAPIAPGMAALATYAPKASGFGLLPFAPLLALSYVVLMCLFTAAAKWTLLGRIRAGRYPIWSGFYVRYWFIERLNFMALGLLHSIFATLYVRPWYRLMGARMGRRCEISSASAVSHDLIDFGEESFIADGVSFGAARMEPGALRLASTRVGRRTFVGNSALLPTGATVADGVLIGVLSKPPEQAAAAAEAGVTWFGSPPLRLPNRPTARGYSEERLFRPGPRLIVTRLAIEFLRITLAPTLFLALFCAMLGLFDALLARPNGFLWLVGALPLLVLGFNLAAAAAVLALKWTVIGRYRPRTAPLWSLFVWRTELVTSTHEALLAGILGALQGTPYINIFLRLMGCRIGKRVFTDTTDITEFDLVRVGDDAALNADCGLQTHLFEDRVMKLGPITVGARAAVGQLSIVLYDGGLEDDARLGDLSVTMKGEMLPAGAAWEGSPAQAVVD